MNSVFKEATPIWLKNKRAVKNLQAGFRCDFIADSSKKYLLRISGATYYKVYLNGAFIGYGPARAAHGYVKYDELDLPIQNGQNILAVEVTGSNCTSFYTLPQMPFICAEILENDHTVYYTGRDFKGLSLEKLRNIFSHRYSYQRGFGEVWNFDGSDFLSHWTVSDSLSYDPISNVSVDECCIPRTTLLPDYQIISAKEACEYGKIQHKNFSELTLPRYITELSTMHSDGYHINEWTENPIQELYGDFLPEQLPSTNAQGQYFLSSREYMIFRLPFNDTGFLKNRILAQENSKVILFFSEYNYGNGMIFQSLNSQTNIVTYNLKKNAQPYFLETFEPYTCQYIGIAVIEGCISAALPQMREYSYPEYQNLCFSSADTQLNAIITSAQNTFRQNTLDVFMDCPGRERAGWLCDSYFTANSEIMFTSKSEVEKAFLENFVMAKEFPNLPNGMLPHNYPSGISQYQGGFIPQWAMWFVVELEEYCKERTNTSPEKYRTLCYDLLAWFLQYENEYGLLENMPGWNFVEWSKANDWVQDVNYPTNMLYSKMLFIMAELFDDDSLCEKAENLKKVIIDQSFNGTFFRDHAVRNESGILIPAEHYSETCQYYAYFFEIADTEIPNYKQLTHILIHTFGPQRENTHLLPEIAPSNAFIGNYLRIIVLLRMKEFDTVLENIRGYFGEMAAVTGTLWEHNKLETDHSDRSLNHGFASFAGVALMMAVGGISNLNYAKKQIEIDTSYLSGIDYQITLGTEDGILKFSEDNGKRMLDLPKSWSIK